MFVSSSAGKREKEREGGYLYSKNPPELCCDLSALRRNDAFMISA